MGEGKKLVGNFGATIGEWIVTLSRLWDFFSLYFFEFYYRDEIGLFDRK